MVKRFTFDEGDEAYYDREGFLPAHYQDVVLASDYDALAAELTDWKRMRNEAMAVAMSNRERIRALEAALRDIEGRCRWPDTHTPEMIRKLALNALVPNAGLPQTETICGECGGSGLTMQPGMPDGEPEGKPCPKCKSKQFAPIGNGTICSNCTKTIGYHCQTAAGVLWCEVPKETKGEQG